MGVLQHEQIGSIADGTEHGVRAGSEGHTGQHTLSRAHLHFVSITFFCRFGSNKVRSGEPGPGQGYGRLHVGVLRHHSAVMTCRELD